MRRLLLAVVLLTVPLTGCFDGQPGYTLDSPDAPGSGLLLTYEIDQGDGTEIQQLMTYQRPDGPGYDLLVYNGTRTVESPFTELHAKSSPRAPAWAGFLQFPLADGESYQADAVAAVEDATVSVEALDNATAPFDGRRAFLLTATGPEGETLATVEYLERPTIPARIDIQVEDHEETWRLVAMDQHPGWNEPPAWKLGRWWTYDATTRVETGALTAEDMTMVFSERAPGSSGVRQAFLNTVELEDREAALPFHQIRTSDLASQSGILTQLVSKMWDWPLKDGLSWGGTTFMDGEDKQYSAAATLERDHTLPDGTVTLAFEIEMQLAEDGRTIGAWTYAPLVGFFTELNLQQVEDDAPQLDWQLEGWGTGYHGPMELPRTRTLLASQTHTGPANLTLNATVEDPIEVVEIRGFAGRSEGASPDNRVRLVDPNGTVRYRIDEDDFSLRTGFSFVERVPASTGQWSVEMDLQDGTSIALQHVRGIWPETVEKDFR